MMQMLGVYRFIVIIGCLFYCVELVHGHRSDVYIAGFFPYGLGKENSETGKSFVLEVIDEEVNVVSCGLQSN